MKLLHVTWSQNKWSPAAAKSLQSCPTLYDPMNGSLPGSSVHGILQTRILEWIAMSFSWGSSQPRAQTWVSYIAGVFFTIWSPGKPKPPTNLLTWSSPFPKPHGCIMCTHGETLHSYKKLMWLDWAHQGNFPFVSKDNIFTCSWVLLTLQAQEITQV